MARCAVSGMTKSLNRVKARVREVIHDGRFAHSRANDGGLSGSFGLIRSVMYNHDEGKSPVQNMREKNRASSYRAPHKQNYWVLRDGRTLREEVAKLIDRVNKGTNVKSYAYNHILKWCSEEKDLESVIQVHDSVKDSSMEQHPYVAKMLLKCYIECGRLETAQETFKKLMKKDIVTWNMRKDTVTWNMMIVGCAKNDQTVCAIELYKQMREEGGQPDAITFLSVLRACANPAGLNWGREIHADITRDGFQGDVRICNALVRMYSNCGSIEDARAVFYRMKRHDLWSWNTMIGGLAEHGLGYEAFSLFLQMQGEGFAPDAVTYLSILNPCSSTGATEWVKEVHTKAMEAGFDGDLRVGNALVHMYAKIGLIADSRQVFDKMPNRDLISWTTMIGGLAQHGQGREALQLLKQMKSMDVTPDNVLFSAVLSACSHAGLVEEGSLLFASMREDFGIEPDIEVYTCMVDMLGRAGKLEEAKLVIRNMPIKPNIVIWKALLGACKTHNDVELARLAAEECLMLNPTDEAPYVLLSNVYAGVGDWDQVSLVRSKMQERGLRKKDPGRCWIVVDNKVHQFLVGDTSHPEAREIYALLSSLSNKLKAEGHVANTRLILRHLVEEDKESVICSHSEKLAIAYGLLHLPAGKPIRVYKNLRMCTDCHAATKLISKITGREIVARDAIRFHHFQNGLCSCGDYW